MRLIRDMGEDNQTWIAGQSDDGFDRINPKLLGLSSDQVICYIVKYIERQLLLSCGTMSPNFI